MIEDNDMAGLGRALDALVALSGSHRTIALFNPQTRRRENLMNALRSAAAKNIPFMLDVYTSDAQTVGGILTQTSDDADPKRGTTSSIEFLGRLRQDPTIGNYFIGLRFFEVMAQDFTVKTCLERRAGPQPVNWCDRTWPNIAGPDFFDESVARSYLEFARQQGMMVLWADWKWDPQTKPQQDLLERILQSGDYSRTVVLGYANNRPNEANRADLSGFESWIARYRPWVGKYIEGLALSSQAWVCDMVWVCPTHVIETWTRRALDEKLAVVQFEPSNYFFDLPRGKPDPNYPDGPRWRENSGRPAAPLVRLAEMLGAKALNPSPALSRLPFCEDFQVSARTVHIGEHLQATGRVSVLQPGENISLRFANPSLVGELHSDRQEAGASIAMDVEAKGPVGPQRLHVFSNAPGSGANAICSALVNIAK